MPITEILELIDKKPDIFTERGCDINCLKQACYCEN